MMGGRGPGRRGADGNGRLGPAGGGAMKASVGDRIVTASGVVGGAVRDGVIVELRHDDGSPPYLVEWSDTDERTLVYPGSDSYVEHVPGTRTEDGAGTTKVWRVQVSLVETAGRTTAAAVRVATRTTPTCRSSATRSPSAGRCGGSRTACSTRRRRTSSPPPACRRTCTCDGGRARRAGDAARRRARARAGRGLPVDDPRPARRARAGRDGDQPSRRHRRGRRVGPARRARPARGVARRRPDARPGDARRRRAGLSAGITRGARDLPVSVTGDDAGRAREGP